MPSLGMTLVTRRLRAVGVQARGYSAPAYRSVPPNKQRFVPVSGTYPKGFLVGSTFAGVKPSNTKYDDVAVVVSEKPCRAAAVFTQNIFKAAPVGLSRHILREKMGENITGVVVNSGCANAITGSQGHQDAREMARATDRTFNAEASAEENPSTIVMSTGVIGQRLPIQKITTAIPSLTSRVGNSHEHWLNAANAICTTDTFPKLLSRTFSLPSHPDTTYSIAGMTKGAGMIHPNMATLLAIVCTDANIEAAALKKLLGSSVGPTFNSISVDGDTSTNDTLAILANGAAAPPGRTPLTLDDCTRNAGVFPNEDAVAFDKILRSFLKDLAKLVVRDGEGATKFVRIRVRSNDGVRTAKRAATSIARSALVKTALYGKDANWGRIICAVGNAPGIMNSYEVNTLDLDVGATTRRKFKDTETGKNIDPKQTSVSFIPTDGSPELRLLVNGEPQDVDEARAKQILEMEDLEILVELKRGSPRRNARMFEAEVFTCDFSHEYVTINGDYRT
jgi:glutamate N-acetyltransferase/amino-acid N-acetyltransferase